MQIHSLNLVDEYSLIGIHSSVEDYKLAYLLNSNLNMKFKKSNFSLDFENNNISFPIFEFIDDKNQLSYHLISNKFTGQTTQNSSENLFSINELFSNTSLLIPEKKNIDYFLKIEGEITTIELYKTIEKINNTSQIITSYTINPDKLNSKDYLIF